jgi:glycosyltransferase involved in cell wall biosynthesis
MNWVIVTGAYPPDEMGLADYAVLVSEELAARGDRVWIFAGAGPDTGRSSAAGVTLRRFPAHFGLRALTLMSRELGKVPQPRQMLLLYVPQAFGPRAWMQKRRFRGVPLALCLWLQLLHERVWTTFFEAAVVPGPNPSRSTRVLAAATRWMLNLALRKSSRVMVATPALAEVIREVTGREPATEWLPVPSTLPVRIEPARVAGLRRRLLGEDGETLLGHFSSYRPAMADLLYPMVESLLRDQAKRRLILIGQGSEDFAAKCRAAWPELAPQFLATGNLPAQQAAEHLSACDVVVEPYLDGVTTQRTSTMGPLALGCLIVTNDGPWTEPVWRESGAVALAASPDAGLLAAKVEEVLRTRPALGERAAQLYAQRFSLGRLVDAITSPSERAVIAGDGRREPAAA